VFQLFFLFLIFLVYSESGSVEYKKYFKILSIFKSTFEEYKQNDNNDDDDDDSDNNDDDDNDSNNNNINSDKNDDSKNNDNNVENNDDSKNNDNSNNSDGHDDSKNKSWQEFFNKIKSQCDNDNNNNNDKNDENDDDSNKDDQTMMNMDHIPVVLWRIDEALQSAMPKFEDLIEWNSTVFIKHVLHITHEAKCRECDAIVTAADYIACSQCNILYCRQCFCSNNEDKHRCAECDDLTKPIEIVWMLYFIYQHCEEMLKIPRDDTSDSVLRSTTLYISIFDKSVLFRPAAKIAINEIIQQILTRLITPHNVIAMIKHVFESHGYSQWFLSIRFKDIYETISPYLK